MTEPTVKLYSLAKRDTAGNAAELSIARRGVALIATTAPADVQEPAGVPLAAAETVELLAVLLEAIGPAEELAASPRFRGALMGAGFTAQQLAAE